MNNTELSEGKHSNDEVIKVTIERGKSNQKEFFFSSSFTIGRSEECNIRIDEGAVSRVHAEVKLINGKWEIIDNQSRNGIYFNGNKISCIELKNTSSIELGTNGPILLFTFEKKKETASTHAKKDLSLSGYIEHYFQEKNEQEIGEHTKLVREAFKVVKKKQTSKYKVIIAAAVIIAIAAAVYSYYQYTKENKQKQLAENIFYDMKSLELEISALKDKLSGSGDQSIVNALEKFDKRHRQLETNYRKLVDDLGVYDLNEEDKIIIHMARVFGECELGMPKGFIDEVNNYISKWKSSQRLLKALERAKQNGYPQVIVNYLSMQQLPPQFFYLALQESDFKEQIVGPQTRYGYAKGMWQFIAETAKRYGLTIGPLAAQNVYDPGDDRFNFLKATSAASRYLKDIYNTDAQASGLLVMASYNWGEHNIINLIRKMPENPRERNFWQLLDKYRENIPDETYNYVFYIFSAAVIGENPSLFGFNFDNPLKESLQHISN